MYPFKSNTYIENIENRTVGNTIINIIKVCFKDLHISVPQRGFSWSWLSVLFFCVPVLFKLLGSSLVFIAKEYLKHFVQSLMNMLNVVIT